MVATFKEVYYQVTSARVMEGTSQFRGQSGKQRTSPGMHAQERGFEESTTITHLSVPVLWTWPREHMASSQVDREAFPKVASTSVK